MAFYPAKPQMPRFSFDACDTWSDKYVAGRWLIVFATSTAAPDDGDDPIGTATRLIFHIPSLVLEADVLRGRAKNISKIFHGFNWLLFMQHFIIRFDFKC